MIELARYAMKSERNAWMLGIAFAVLGLIFGPAGFVAGGILALTTIRQNFHTSFKQLLLVSVAALVTAWLLLGSALPGLGIIAQFLLPVWLVAMVYAHTQSLDKTLLGVAALILVATVIVFTVVADPAGFWRGLIDVVLQPLLLELPPEKRPDTAVLDQLAEAMTLILAVSGLLLWWVTFVVGKYWEYHLYADSSTDDGVSLTTVSQLRLPTYTLGLLLLSVLWFVLDGGLLDSVSTIVMAVMGVLYLLYGLTIVHWYAQQKQTATIWLVLLYVLLMWVPEVMFLVASLGVVDQIKPLRTHSQLDPE